ncbi:high mobility group box, partial [Gloeophyllum trabeum ATCC 11539]
MAGPSRTQTVQPPRPPNAWILYRSDKLKTLPPVPPGMPRRAQADVSREISLMWKNEREEVRAQYERLAEVRKAQHQNAYPGYRYHP